MKIEFGKALDNKTWKFLIPCLRGYGEVFVSKFNNQIFKLAYGIDDKIMQGAKILEDKRPIFIMIDKAVLPREFSNFMEWVEYQPYYITDYNADIVDNPRLHMLVLDAPEKYYKAYDKFTVGLYSEMYSKEQLNELFDDKESIQYKILSRDPKYSNTFLKKVEDEFSVRMKGVDKEVFISTAEYEFPYSLNSEEEIFNS